jgi:hypothetical protein
MAQDIEALLDGVGCRPFWSEAVGVPVSGRFRYRIEREQIQGLHRSTGQGRNP